MKEKLIALNIAAKALNVKEMTIDVELSEKDFDEFENIVMNKEILYTDGPIMNINAKHNPELDKI